MTKYNVSESQQRIVRALVDVYETGYDQEFMYLGRIGATPSITFWGRKDSIPASKSDLQALYEEGFITVRGEKSGLFGTLKQLAFDAIASNFQIPETYRTESVTIGNFIQTMTGGNVQGAAGSHISMTQNIDQDLSALMQRFDVLTDQLTEIFTQYLKGSELRDALAEISAVHDAIKDRNEDTAVVARKSRSLGERLLALLDIGDKTSGTIQTAIYATEALVVLGGWLNTAYQIVQQMTR